MPKIKCWQVDAFTNRPFGGNPAAICWLEHDVPDDWMQSVAAEMNLSETAFVRRQGDEYNLRWFTPQVEVPLCGHATLAAAHVLWDAGHHSPEESIGFRTQSGVLTCKQSQGFIEMDFPASPVQPINPPANLLKALGIAAAFVGTSQFDFLVVVEDAETVRSLAPDFRLLKDILERGVMVTSRSDDAQFEFISRFFAPAVGIDEDPVTGSAHCCLAPYWSDVLEKSELTALQASSRGGVVRTRVDGDRVVLGGQAVTVWHGDLLPLP